jgi:hypothetical protein
LICSPFVDPRHVTPSEPKPENMLNLPIVEELRLEIEGDREFIEADR